MNSFISLIILVSVSSLMSMAYGEDDPAIGKQLLHDPFKKPERLMPSAQIPATEQKEENLFQSNSRLTATLRAGRNSMVIVDGKTIKLGETVDGFHLIDVKEHSAVFSKNGQPLILELDKTDEIK